MKDYYASSFILSHPRKFHATRYIFVEQCEVDLKVPKFHRFCYKVCVISRAYSLLASFNPYQGRCNF